MWIFVILSIHSKNKYILNADYEPDIVCFMAASAVCGSSPVRDWIWATAATILDPLTHCTRPGCEPAPPQPPEPWQSDS